MFGPKAGLTAAGVAVTVTATCLALTGGPAGSAPAPAAGAPAAAAAGLSWQTVTLVTGDQVRVATGARGPQAIQVRPGPGRSRVAFFSRERGGDLSVLPSDAAPLVAAGRLDPALFDVTALVRDGYADAARPSLPLIVGYRAGQRALAPRGTAAVRTLASLNGAAVAEPRAAAATVWPQLTGAAVARVWLDQRVHALLDQSVPQIGAPAAWQLGLTGKGVTVGVLDTGIDASHPDLADAVAVAQDFTGSPNGTRDMVGHGTHVASIITGSGAASGGRFVGVAPDAKLAVGKVLDDSGNGSFSQIIAGMEWVTQQHAAVVNMSLGQDLPSDGTDPLSAAVDELTARTGTLFVIAAGNAGRDENGIHDESLDLPGVAESALTVGAVDKQDALADFSSRGPRLGDAGVKPDITAPGVDITAARAAGTEDGEPVGDAYVTLSGTSTATPHVAGAAAILAQQHPDWTAAQLKTALMNTARPNPDNTVYEQGAGRVDVARAVTTQVAASPASLSFDLPAGQRDPATRTVTLRNDGAADVTLTVAADGPATADAATLTVPAHGTARTTVSVDPAAAPTGRHSGRLTFASADGTQRVTVPVGVVTEPPAFTVRVAGIDRNGNATGTTLDNLPFAQLIDLATGAAAPVFLSGAQSVARVPAGRYELSVFIDTLGADGVLTSSTLVSMPELTVDRDLTVTADARLGHRISVGLDSRTAVQSGFDLAGAEETIAGQFAATGVGTADPAVGLYATPTPVVRSRPYGFYYKTVRAEPLTGPAPRAYNLAQIVAGRIPDRLDLRVRDRDLARLDTRYHADGAALTGQRFTGQALPGEDIPFGGGSYDVRLPGARTELYSASPGLRWQRLLSAGTTPDALDLSENADDPPLRPGLRIPFDWNTAAYGPVVQSGPLSKCGKAGVLIVAYPFVSPGDFWAQTDGSQHLDVSRDGTQVGSVDGLGSCFPIATGPASYAVHLTADRSLPWTALGTHTDATWTSAWTPDQADPFDGPPMINLRTAGAFDLRDTAPAGRPFRLDVTSTLETVLATVPERSPIRLTSAEVSTDDGATWHRVPVRAAGADHWTLLVSTPAGARFASLRLRAADGSGDAVEQTVIRAYGLR